MTPVREGDLLAGKYRIERVLGVGGMGVVVAARHEQLGQLVAIKFVREDALGNEDAVERFLREARSAVRLRSEHVARVIDVGKLDSGAPYMVMEYLDGDDLGQILEERGAMAPEPAVQLVLQACEAVAEAHAAGIVHRDLKPQNLFLTQTITGRPKLKVLDFGVSKTASLTTGGQGALTRTRSMLGSPLYMSPEQMRSARDVDARADVWALGVVLYELLTRRWPFEAQNIPELCLKVVTEPPQPITSFRSDLLPGLVAIIERCLEKDPARRYLDAAALAVALEPFGPELPVRRSPSSATLEPPPAPITPQTLASGQISSNSKIPTNSKESSQVTSAPSAWDSMAQRVGATSVSSPRGKRFVWIGAALALLVCLGAFGLSQHGTGGPQPSPSVAAAQLLGAPPHADSPSPPASAPPASAPPAPPVVAAVAEAVLAPAPTLAPLEPTAPPPRMGPGDAGATKLAAVARPVKPSQRPAPAQTGTTKPDDDIPALR